MTTTATNLTLMTLTNRTTSTMNLKPTIATKLTNPTTPTIETTTKPMTKPMTNLTTTRTNWTTPMIARKATYLRRLMPTNWIDSNRLNSTTSTNCWHSTRWTLTTPS